MDIFYFIGIIIIFYGLQFILSRKTNNRLPKYFLISVITIGLLFCVVLYLNVFWADSPSVIAENQYFARFIGFPLAAGFMGCILGLSIYKPLKEQ